MGAISARRRPPRRDAGFYGPARIDRSGDDRSKCKCQRHDVVVDIDFSSLSIECLAERRRAKFTITRVQASSWLFSALHNTWRVRMTTSRDSAVDTVGLASLSPIFSRLIMITMILPSLLIRNGPAALRYGRIGRDAPTARLSPHLMSIFTSFSVSIVMSRDYFTHWLAPIHAMTICGILN